MLFRRLLFGLILLRVGSACMSTDPDANIFFDLLGIPSLREYLGGDIEIDFGTLNPLIRLPNPFGEFKVRFPCELNCAHFDAHGSWPCRWRNEISAAAECQSAQCSTDQLDWVRAKNSWGVEEGITIFGTEKTATRYYILAGTQERQHPTAAALLTSDPIQCQEGDGFLQFRYWTSPRTTIRVCIRMVGSATIRSYQWCSAEISRGDPGPATVRLPGSVMSDFEIVIEASNFTFEGFGKQGGMVILDDLRYWAAAIYNCRNFAHFEPIPQQSCAAIRCTFAEDDKCSHHLGGFRRTDDADIPHPRGIPKSLPYPANWSGDLERFAVATRSAAMKFGGIELPRAVAVEFCATAIGDGVLELWATLRGYGRQRLWATTGHRPRLHSATTRAMGVGKRRLRRDASKFEDSALKSKISKLNSKIRQNSHGRFVNRTEPPKFIRIASGAKIADGTKTAIPIGRRVPSRQSFDRRVARLRDWLFGDLFAAPSRKDAKWSLNSTALHSAGRSVTELSPRFRDDESVSLGNSPASSSDAVPPGMPSASPPNWETAGEVVEDSVISEAAWECPRIHLHAGTYDSIEFVASFHSPEPRRPTTEPRRRGDSHRWGEGAVALGAIRLVGANGEATDPCAVPFDPFAEPPPHPSMCGVDCSLGCGCAQPKAATGCEETANSATSPPINPFAGIPMSGAGGLSPFLAIGMSGTDGKPAIVNPFEATASGGSDAKPELVNPFPPMGSLPNPLSAMESLPDPLSAMGSLPNPLNSKNPLAAAMEALTSTATRPIAHNRGVGDSWLGLDLSPNTETSPLDAIFAPLKSSFGVASPNLPANLFPTFAPNFGFGDGVPLVDGSSRPTTTPPTVVSHRLRPLPERFPFLKGVEDLGAATNGDRTDEVKNFAVGSENSSLNENWNPNDSDFGETMVSIGRGDANSSGDDQTAKNEKKTEATRSRAAATPITAATRQPATDLATGNERANFSATTTTTATPISAITNSSASNSAIANSTEQISPNSTVIGESLWPLFTDIADRIPADAEISFGGIADNDPVSGEVKWKFFGPKASDKSDESLNEEFGEDLSDVAETPFEVDPTAFAVEEAKRFQLTTTTESSEIATVEEKAKATTPKPVEPRIPERKSNSSATTEVLSSTAAPEMSGPISPAILSKTAAPVIDVLSITPLPAIAKLRTSTLPLPNPTTPRNSTATSALPDITQSPYGPEAEATINPVTTEPPKAANSSATINTTNISPKNPTSSSPIPFPHQPLSTPSPQPSTSSIVSTTFPSSSTTIPSSSPKSPRRPFLGDVAIMRMQLITTTPRDDSIFPADDEMKEEIAESAENFSNVHLPIESNRFPTEPPQRIQFAATTRRPRRKPTTVF